MKVRRTIAEPPKKNKTCAAPASAEIRLKNIDKQMYAKSKYKSKCVLCGQAVSERLLVNHYANEHADAEVFISRLSPEMAAKLRDQSTQFRLNGCNIIGFCYFCGEIKDYRKYDWLRHLCMHTGEKLHKRRHNKCTTLSNIENIFEGSEENDGLSIIGYMCKECNYIQLAESRLKMHIKNEHGVGDVDLTQLYDTIFMVKEPIIEIGGE